MRRLLDTKVYEIRLLRDRKLIGDLGRIARNLTWSVNRNPKVGYDKITFSVDQTAFNKWCQDHGATVETMIRPIKTDCQVWVRNTPTSDNVCVAHGYLSAMPALEANGDAMDFKFEFYDQFMKLAGGSLIPNGTRYNQWYADDICMNIINTGAARQGTAPFGFKEGPRLSDRKLITRQYDDWKPEAEAIAEMTDNTTGQGPFDIWIDKDYAVNFANVRGKNSGLTFVYPYDPAQDTIPMSALPEYPDVPELMTCIRAVGEGQGDAAITTFQSDATGIETYGWIEGYKQYSGITTLNALEQKAKADLQNALNPNPAPTITVNGVFIDWASFGVGDRIDYRNDVAVGYGVQGHVRVKTIEVNCDENRNESIKLITEQYDGN